MYYPLDINLLKPYMLTGENINHYLSYSIHNKINKVLDNKFDSKGKNFFMEKKEKSPFFIPKQKDSLFWCFYIIVNGLDKYENINNINIVMEKTIKIELVEQLRCKKDVLRANKCAPLLHIENMLVNEIKIDMKTFIALCIIKNINFLFIKNKFYYEYRSNSLEPINVLYFNKENNSYGLELEVKDEKINDYRNNLYNVTNLDKPIKALSSYKSEELIEIAKKIGLSYMDITTGKNLLKKQMYESILQYFS